METLEKVKEVIRLLKLAEERHPGTKDSVLPQIQLRLNQSVSEMANFIDKDLEIVKIFLTLLEPERMKICPICKYVYLTPWYYNGECKKCKGDVKNDD